MVWMFQDPLKCHLTGDRCPFYIAFLAISVLGEHAVTVPIFFICIPRGLVI